jgi:hypothetical protein
MLRCKGRRSSCTAPLAAEAAATCACALLLLLTGKSQSLL